MRRELCNVGRWLACVLMVLSAAAQPSTAQPLSDVGVSALYTGTPITPGTTALPLACDDCTAPVNFPFPIHIYGQTFTSANVSSNGNIQFTGNSTQFQDECLPTSNMGTMVCPLWDDLIASSPGDGVFTSVTGSAPNRAFNIEWRMHYFGAAGSANFECRFFENSRLFEFVYGVYTGTFHTIGAQRGHGELYRDFRCNFANPLAPGSRLVWTSDAHTGSFQGTSSNGRTFPTGTTQLGAPCDDCVFPVSLPFPVTFYAQTYTSANVSTNGNIQFASANAEYANVCLPAPGFGPTLFAHWDDLVTTGGIFTRVSGTAPFRTFDVEWRAVYFTGGGSINFAVRFFEGLDFEEVYFNTATDHGSSSTMGVQAGDERYESYRCNELNAANPDVMYSYSVPPVRVLSPGVGSAPFGTTDIGNHCDDCITTLPLPFTVTLFGQSFTSANISSNGNIQFGSADAGFTNPCLPAAGLGTTVAAHWDDLRTDGETGGIFTRLLGDAPNRLLIIEWRATYFTGGAQASFSAVLYEQKPYVQVYDGPTDGASATEAVQRAGGSQVLTFSCNAGSRIPSWVEFVCLPPPCAADWNQDGAISSQDFFGFITDFFALNADFNHDGTTNSQDFFAFLQAFFVGCP